jgi:hypothetical protein
MWKKQRNSRELTKFWFSNSKRDYWGDENDESYQLDATIVIYYHKLFLHVSGIYMPIFRRTCCMLLHMVFVYKLTHSAQDYAPAPWDHSYNT